ncbi:SMI1/KNR4 family protein [Ktedonospora formicarum]|uniref:Knr4/Smi1-like domain-containing protein n=1 Tax=Ktedonospora formicarum TaxID=2778364 RepID=A0A8J3IBR3_9CHLR|nr:SMI1/KNR4 family protein [Ktedonospora formicarum]GHO49159.1 hypothetical protein KSX_73220 [Ktedonospora formicarum]
MDSIERLWDRIESWLAANAPDIAKALQPGVTEEEIREIEAGMGGLVFPEDVKASYRRHNGYYSGSFLMNQSIFYDLASMFGGPSGWEEQVLARKPSHLSGPIQPVWWHPAWLPLTGDGAGDLWCIDLAPASGGQVGQIISFSHEVGPTQVIATSFHELLSSFTDQLEANQYVADGLNLTEPENIWMPEDRTRSNPDRVREGPAISVPMISTRASISASEFADSINRLYREVCVYLEQQGIQPLIEYVMRVFARYEERQNGQLALEVGIAVEEARSDDPHMLAGTFPGGTSAMLPQICYRTLERIIYSEEEDREFMGPADPRIIAEEGFDALEKWSKNTNKPLTGQPWIMFTVSPQDPQAIPVADTTVHFEVHKLLKS